MFRHPKYYKELRKRNKSDQAISKEPATAGNQRSPGPGLKLGEMDIASSKLQAASSRDQASSNKLTKSQASSSKHQAPSTKAQA